MQNCHSPGREKTEMYWVAKDCLHFYPYANIIYNINIMFLENMKFKINIYSSDIFPIESYFEYVEVIKNIY